MYSRFGDYRNPQSMIAGVELTYYAEDIIIKKVNTCAYSIILLLFESYDIVEQIGHSFGFSQNVSNIH